MCLENRQRGNVARFVGDGGIGCICICIGVGGVTTMVTCVTVIVIMSAAMVCCIDFAVQVVECS